MWLIKKIGRVSNYSAFFCAMAWLPTQEEVSGFLSSWNTRKLLTTIRKHRDSVTQQTFKCGLNRVLLAACREGDVTVLEELLPLSLSCYPIDHLFSYKVQASKKKSDFLHNLETYRPTPEYYVPPFNDKTFVPTKDLQGSLLHIAAEEGKTKVVELLLEHGAKLDSINCCGRTPLMVSAENVKISKFFIESGCNVNHQDKFGQTILMLLIWKPKSFKALFELLLKAGADPKIKDQYGKTMVHYACELKYDEGVVPLLVDKNVFEIDCKENGMVYYAETPLSIRHSFKHFQNKDVFSPAFVLFSQFCELMILSSDFKKKLPPILDSIKDLGVSYNHAVSEPMYGNRKEITTLDELNKLHTSASDWSMEVNYQRLIISDRIFGHDSEESITFLWFIFHDMHYPNPSVDADLVYLWLDKLSSLLEKRYITHSCLEKFYYLAINGYLDSLSFVGKYNMVDIVSKFTKCVKLLLHDRPMNHRHRYHMSPFGDDGVVPIGLEFIKSIHPSVAPALAYKMADFLQEAFRGKLELDPTLLHDMVTSCEIHPHEDREDRITVHQSNILYMILLRQDDHQYDDNTLKFCEYICGLSSVDLVNSAIPKKQTLLHFAVEVKSPKLVHFLLAQGAHPDAVDGYGLSPAERCDNNSEFKLMLKPDRLFCIASRAIIKENLPYQTFDLPDKVKSSIRFHDKERFKIF